MKNKMKLFSLSMLLVMLLGAGSAYAFGGSCSYVSGASVKGSYIYNDAGEKIKYSVTLSNRSGSRCSASCVVEAKDSQGNWEVLEEMILTADNNASDCASVDIRGYVAARVVNVSTWKCD